MRTFPIRVLLVDDYGPWRRFVRSIVQAELGLEVIDEASDGLEAVQKADQLQPDLILLDIGLPKLSGIEAARRIRLRSPQSIILFFSENHSSDIVEEALRRGGLGYVLKSDGARELLPAVEAVLEGKQFVSASVSVNLNQTTDEDTADHVPRKNVVTLSPHNTLAVGHHEVLFYSDDQRLVEGVTQFIGSALKGGNAAIVVATDSHRDSLFRGLQTYGLDVGACIEQGRYIALDAAHTLSTFLVNGVLDSLRFVESFDNLILRVGHAAKSEHPRVAIFGEGADLLWKGGNAEAAIQDEKLCNKLTERYHVDILCAYSQVQVQSDDEVFQRICAEHSAVYSP